MAVDFGPYSTIKPLVGGGLADWLSEEESQLRVASYDMYEAIYWCVEDAFKLIWRGTPDNPIYVPAGRSIVETLHRFLANDMEVIPDPLFGSDSERLLAERMFTDLARREKFYSKFNMNKRLGIIRGDWVFHMKGDPERPEGSRISIETIHPGQLFPIMQDSIWWGVPDGDSTIQIGWNVVERVMDGNEAAILRTTYLKDTKTGGPSGISMEQVLCKSGAWGGPGQEKIEAIRGVLPPQSFPAPIDQLPIYHIPNFQNESLWGSSEMRGLERVIAAIDQSISDEELEIMLNGIGVYVTDAPKP